MAKSNYDVNLQLALATTAEYEGDLAAARGFLAEARRSAGVDRDAHVQVYRHVVQLRARQQALASTKLVTALRRAATLPWRFAAAK